MCLHVVITRQASLLILYNYLHYRFWFSSQEVCPLILLWGQHCIAHYQTQSSVHRPSPPAVRTRGEGFAMRPRSRAERVGALDCTKPYCSYPYIITVDG